MVSVQPFRFKGKDHKSAARLDLERRTKATAEKKARKSSLKSLRKRERKKRGLSKGELIARCRILGSDETAAQAMDRSIAESRLPQKAWYREIYLFSDHWRALKRHALLTLGVVCEKCKDPSLGVDIHHLQYRNIFDVRTPDLQVLCRSCHDKAHGHPPTDPNVTRPGRYRCASGQQDTDSLPFIV